MTKKISLFPAPHLELRIHVSEEMIADFWECKRKAEETDWESCKDCDTCSWNKVKLTENFNTCELLGLEEAIKSVK